MRGIVGGIDVQQDLAALAHLVAAKTDELLDQSVIEAHQVAGAGRVLPAAEGRLGAERVAEFLIGDDLQHGIVAQTIGVVGIFMPGHDLVDALSQQFERVVTDALVLPRIAEWQRPCILGVGRQAVCRMYYVFFFEEVLCPPSRSSVSM